jgi:hypothetical protein
MKDGLMEQGRIIMMKKMMVVRFLGRCNVSSACSHTLTHRIAFALYLIE